MGWIEGVAQRARGGPDVLVAIAAMVVLAGLDLAGVVLARQWADNRSVLALVGGIAVFAALFAVFAASLDHAELATVTFGWIVILQVGVILLERFRHGVAIGPDRLGIMVAILALQAYLILVPGGAR
jgi:hypothetical protein